MFNTLYADKMGNIYYVYNGLIPIRDLDAPWYGILPGDKSDLIWNKYYSYDMLPQVLNPDNGYLQNCNSTPYLATVGDQNPKRYYQIMLELRIFKQIEPIELTSFMEEIVYN